MTDQKLKKSNVGGVNKHSSDTSCTCHDLSGIKPRCVRKIASEMADASTLSYNIEKKKKKKKI